MTQIASSYIPTGGATATRNADVLPLPFPARPQAMTVYVRFVELGTIKDPAGDFPGIFHIGGPATVNDPRFEIQESGGKYQLRHDNGIINVTATLAAASDIGDLVELRGVLNADGSVQMGQSINSAAETTTAVSDAAVLGPAWHTPRIYINSRGEERFGFIALRNLVFHRGVQSLETMRRLAGV